MTSSGSEFESHGVDLGALTPGQPDEIEGRSLWTDAWGRLRRNRAAVASIAILAIFALLSVLVPMLWPYPIDEIFWTSMREPPSSAHWFGTDPNGRDLFVRTMYGGRVSLMVGILAAATGLIIGVAYGATAGYLGGRWDGAMMRIVDVLYSLPQMFFVIVLMVVFGRNIFLIFIAIGALEWLDMARIVRGETLSIKRKEYVEAATAGGVTSSSMITRHIIPNAIGPVVIYVTMLVPKVILIESFLSFLGLGVQEPMTSWGVLIAEGAVNMESSWWLLGFPAAFLAVTLFALNFVGDGLRDALDPRDR
jgi:oligopeptide transport system permease protein